MEPLAHGIGGRSDLPVPLWLAVYGGAVAVLVSFFALLVFWTQPKLRGERAGWPVPVGVQRVVDAAGSRGALRVVGLVLATAVMFTAWAGPDDPTRNPAPTWFYVWFWVGLAALSVLFGPVWRVVNPLRTITAAVLAAGGGRLARRELPEGMGYWPAVASLLVFVWLELVYDRASEPRTVALFLTGYALVHVAAGLVYGERWFDRGDGFEVYSTLFGHLSPLGRREDGRVVLRNPLDGLAALQPAPGLVATVSVVLGSTAFDGLTRVRFWKDFTAYLDRPLYLLIGTAGLVVAIQFVLGTYTAATMVMRRYAPADAEAGIDIRFVHSLVPIAVGYTVAHYFSFAIFQGQAGYLLATDPLGRGWDLLGAAGRGIDYTLVMPKTIALVQVIAIVVGHVVGVVAAHDRAVGTFERRDQQGGQYPLLGVMVGYTMGGIALLVGT
ncbi:MAG TPA: hypothetical protein VFM54_05770 [Micromonosporaceae bacterium]|nr:hypothetical protein [Micromonosporaceae bacterium]